MNTRRVTMAMISAFAFLVGSACKATPPVPRRGEAARVECPARGADDYYYPQGALRPDTNADDLRSRAQLSKFLEIAAAPSLSCGTEQHAYRVLWGGGYNDPLLVVTVDARTATVTEFLPFNIATRTIKDTYSSTPSEAQFNALAHQLESAGFWTIDAALIFESEGTSWIFEGRRGRSYRAITRTHPAQALAKIGIRMVQLAGATVPRGMADQAQ